MILKRHSIATKLFVAFLCTSILIILVIMGLISYQMRSGFSDYLLRVELQSFDGLVSAVAEAHEEKAAWSRLAKEPRVWHDLVRGALGTQVSGRRPPPQRRGELRPPRNSQDAGRRPPPPRAPPPAGGRPRPDPLMLGQRLSLLTPDGDYLAGARLEEGSYISRPIHVGNDPANGAVLALLALTSPLDGRSVRDEQFLYEQFRSLFWVCLLALALSALAAFLLARGVVRPIRSLMRGAQALADGNYKARLSGGGPDEIGRLVADFNLLAESLEAAEQAERQWMSDAAHELKTPLAILKGRIEGLQDGIYRADEKLLAEMHDTVERLNRLVGDLNALSHLREGRLACHFQPERFGDLLQDAIDHVSERFAQKGLIVQLNLDPDLILECDRGRIRQLLDNVLENARRYTDAPGSVHISAVGGSGLAPTLRLTIEDSAPCPAASEIDRLFERFYRTDPSRTRQSGGSGLGLAICRAIVEAHQGTIRASVSDLGGLRVDIQLPMIKSD